MTIKRLDHISVVVDDLAAANAFFTAHSGPTLEAEGADRSRAHGWTALTGLKVSKSRSANDADPGWTRASLSRQKFRNPKLVNVEPAIAPPNTLGLRSVMFAVENLDDTVARLRADGAELIGEVRPSARTIRRLCYIRGPAGIIVALAGGTLLKHSSSVKRRSRQLGTGNSHATVTRLQWQVFRKIVPKMRENRA